MTKHGSAEQVSDLTATGVAIAACLIVPDPAFGLRNVNVLGCADTPIESAVEIDRVVGPALPVFMLISDIVQQYCRTILL